MTEHTITYDGPVIEAIPVNVEEMEFFRWHQAMMEFIQSRLFASMEVPERLFYDAKG
jgi:hypothetical protein